MKDSKIERFLVLVFGATTGVTCYEFIVGQGYREIWKEDIPWDDKDSLFVWPLYWLRCILAKVKAEITPGTVVVPSMWGADVVHLAKDSDEIVDKVFHYRSIPEGFANDLISTSDLSRYEVSRRMGYVQPAFYQAVFSSRFWRQNTATCNRDKEFRVIPLADWITWQLTGQKGHDQVMLHNQGLGVSTSEFVNNKFGGSNRSRFAPVWTKFDPSQLLEIGNGAYVVPCTHDSAYARSVLGSTNLPWGLWTGSWYGVCKIMPNIPGEFDESVFNADLVLEAMPNGGVAAISNIGKHGPLYKGLKNISGEISYEEATRLALEKLDRVSRDRLVFSPEVLSLDNFAQVAMERTCGDHSFALAAMVNTLAVNCRAGLAKAAAALGMSIPGEVAIVGGFAENAAILKALENNGLHVVVPPFAGLATQAGAAAHALCLAGMASNTKEALKMFPNVILK